MNDDEQAEAPAPVAEYTDANGLTWQLNEADAKALGLAQVETKVVEAVVETKPPAKRATNTK